MKRLLLMTAALCLVSAAAHAEKITPAQAEEARAYVEKAMHAKYPQVRNLPAPSIDQNSDTFVRMVTRLEHRPVGEVVAFYYVGTIYMRDIPLHMAELVHEMTHHAQEAFALPYPCDKARELEAYDLQNRYALEHDLPDQVVSQAFVNRVSRCEPQQ